MSASSVTTTPIRQGLRDTLTALRSDLTKCEVDARISHICTSHHELDELRAELARLRRRHEALTGRLASLNGEMSEAATVLREMEGTTVPTSDRVALYKFQRPAEHVSGDLCSIRRLDERRIAITLADATGHGVAAAMLTAFCHPLFSTGPADAPREMLERVNEAILGINLSGCQFLTAIHAVLDEQARTLRWSRAGAPYPLHVREDMAAQYLEGDGPMLGVSPDAEFDEQVVELAPGDRVYFSTDGLDNLLQPTPFDHGKAAGHFRSWAERFHEVPLPAALVDLARRYHSMDLDHWDIDDVSVIALEVAPSPRA